MSDMLPALPESAIQTLRRIEAARRPLLVSHVRLDGDALGSELALAHLLRLRGQQPHVVNHGPVPQMYHFMPGVKDVGISADDLRGDYDLVVTLDTPTWKRAQPIRDALSAELPVVSIDHHPSVEQVGDPQWIDPARSSVGEMVYLLARGGGWTISPEAATCLYVAVVTDTGRFTFPNTSPLTFHVAGDLVALGADHVEISERLFQDVSANLLALRGETFQSLRLYAGGRIATMTITDEMLQRHGIDPIDTQEMSDYPRSISGVEVGVLLREMKKSGKVKVSLRARHGVNVEPVARKHGGGGHHAAAGAEPVGTLAEIERVIVADLMESLGWQEAKSAAGASDTGETR